ncbi:lipopolysaccharide biosynthesis protein [Novisyntrophococcus fermenticellae]|uniref:lipopolysaccharide biosynthesis protein n=1 Tax=Novisyntrophococcus fermenticellae TaxID=2068655 RepID=UPI001E493515|nr:lipopolysaccharide biosynthesis protein [Novisyntrophococcus fermenticellae]
MDNKQIKQNNKALLTGTIVYAIGNLGTKILTFLIVPLYTYYISTSDMGDYDLLITSVSLLTPLISLRISDATYNWMIKRTASNEICIKATYNYLLKSCALAVIIIGVASRFIHIWNVGLFLAIMVLEPILETTQKILRGLKNQKLFAASGIIYTGILVSLNFLTVCVLKIGVTSLLVNTVISHIISIALIFCLEKRMRCLTVTVNKSELLITQKEMLKYSMPLVPSTLSWWVMSVSDRYVVRFFLGSSFNGIYAIATKFPSVLQTFFVLFNNAWTDMVLANLQSKEENSKYVSDLFEKMYMFSFSAIFCLIPVTKVITQVILSTDYKIGSIYIGFLYLGAVFQGFSTFASVGYLQSKKTARAATSSLAGAIVNLLVDFILIKAVGLFATALSTYAGFLVMWLVRMYDIRKDWPIAVNIPKFTIMTFVATIIATVTIWTTVEIDAIMTAFFGVLFIALNKNYITAIIKKVKHKR